MSIFAMLLLAGGVIGVFVGMAVQRTRRAYADWRKTVRSIPLLRGVFFAEARHAAWLLTLTGVVLAVMAR